MQKSVVISVNTTAERDIIIRNIYAQLENDADPSCAVVKDRVNRIRVYHYEGRPEDNLRSIVVSYIVVILPIIFSMNPLDGITGEIDFHLDTTINKLTDLVNKLKSFQGHRVIEENTNGEAFEKLVRILS